MRAEVTAALAEAAALGPFFEIRTDPAEEVDPTWRGLPERDTARLLGLTEKYAERLGTGEQRVAASILFQGLASRLWSPVVTAAALGVVPDLSGLHWRWAPGAPIALWLADPDGWRVDDPGKAAELVHREVVERHLRPLRETLRTFVRLADGLVWGNAASALAGTLRAGTLRPDLAAPARAVVDELFTREPLTGTGAFHEHHGFIRRSCCLYYRVPPGGDMCGDCVLLHPRSVR